jgi:prevent-host-death family protein
MPHDHSVMTMAKAASKPVKQPRNTFGVRRIPAGEFKATCLKLIDNVGAGELIITKRGIPVARLVSFSPASDVPLAGLIVAQGDLVSPTSDDWDSEL